MRRVVLLALCAMLLCGCARNNDLADAIASSISVSTPRPTIRPLGKPTAEPKPATEPESEPEPEAYTEEGALYQFCPQAGHPHDCFLLRCEGCGRMVHLDCAHLEEVCQHLSAEHHFRIDPRRTVLTGLCDRCQEAKHEG